MRTRTKTDQTDRSGTWKLVEENVGNESFSGAHAQLTEKIIGVFYEVARELGFGFMESVYRRSMLIALRLKGLKAEEEVAIPVYFRGQWVGTFYADIVVEGIVILELKAIAEITPQHQAQLLHYLRSSPIEVGYVMAFGEYPKFKRVLMQNERKGTRNP